MLSGGRRWLGLGLVNLLVGIAGAGDLPRAEPAKLGFSAARLDYIDQFYTDKINKGELAGIVTLIARHGKIAHFSALGYADVAKKRPMQEDTIFRFYSMTKPVTSTALMMLYEEGRFQLTEPISKYFPEFANLRVLRSPDAALTDTVPLERAPTLQDLLRHTAGFSHGGFPNSVDTEYVKQDVSGIDVPLAETVSKLASIPLLEQPGKKFIYSMGPDIQARLVEILSGMPFDQFLQQRMFKPLGMKDAGFWLGADKAQRLATMHWLKNGKLTPLDDAHGYPDQYPVSSRAEINSYTANHKHKGGSSGLVGTAEDYWRFAQMLLNGGELDHVRVLSPQVVRFMTRDHLASLGHLRDIANDGFGLGFSVVDDPAATGFMSSEGTYFWAGSGATYFWVDPKEDMVVVVLSQHSVVPAADPRFLLPQLHTLVYSALLN
jgi:CubicO group peptidase (beta-lactamase class C family)